MRTLSAICFCGALLGALASAALADVPGMPNIIAHSFPLSAVRLLDGPFKAAMDADAMYLLALDSDRLLAGYRQNAGLSPKATVYGGWEGRGLCGHTLGHYLSACSLMYASTGDDRFRTAAAGGFFSARLRISPGQRQLLHLTYWGGDANRTFDLRVDGKLLATQTLSAQHPQEFFDVDYPLPVSLLNNKQQITVEFRPQGDSVAGGVFGCRMLLANAPAGGK
jgi:hypothetical protein